MDQELTTLLNETILISNLIMSTSYPVITDLISTQNFPLTPFTLHLDLSISTSLCFAWK